MRQEWFHKEGRNGNMFERPTGKGESGVAQASALWGKWRPPVFPFLPLGMQERARPRFPHRQRCCYFCEKGLRHAMKIAAICNRC